MSKGALLAAALIAGGLGTDMEYQDKFDDSSSNEDVKLFTEVTYYAPIAAAMIDAAFGVTFVYPEDWQYCILRNFGEQISDNTDSDDKHDLPDRDYMLSELEELVYNTFEPVATNSQKESLRNAIARARAEEA